MDKLSRQKQISYIINLGLVSNIILAVVKTVTGIFGHSTALLADGINSISDVIYYIFAKVFMKMAEQPADKEHPYGHSQFESISSVVIGAFIVTTGVAIFWDSINKTFDYFTGKNVGTAVAVVSLYIALTSIAVKIVLTLIAFKTAKKVNNSTVMAIAYDHRNDILSSVAATIGIILGKMGYMWVDPLAGAVVAVIIFKTGLGIIADSSNELMSTNPKDEIENLIRESVMKVKGVLSIEGIKVTAFGPYLEINIVICVDGQIKVCEGDIIAEDVERELFASSEYIKGVNIHYHPQK